MGVGVGVSAGMGVDLGVGMDVGMGAGVGPSYKKIELFQFGIFRANSPNYEACSRVPL